MRKHLQKVICFILFIYSRAFNNNVISNGKSYCCNDTFIFVPLTSLLSKNIFKKYKLLLCCYNQHFISYFVWNFHSNWLFFLRVMQENKSGCFFWTQCISQRQHVYKVTSIYLYNTTTILYIHIKEHFPDESSATLHKLYIG